VGLFFFIVQNPPSLGELKNYIGGGFWGVWINSPNPIYVVIILSILKIYLSIHLSFSTKTL
jgi:hypothetical protein